MYQYRTITNVMKGAAALALGGALLAAPAANAAHITLLSATMDTSNTALIQGPSVNINAYIGPIKFTANRGVGNFDFLAYCVDIYHDIYLGTLNGTGWDDVPAHPGVPGYYYHDEGLLTDSAANTAFAQGGTVLSQFQLNQVSSLLNYSNYLIANTANTTLRSRQLAGIQGAIWKVANPGYTIDGSDGVGNVDYWTNIYAADAAVANYMPVGQMKAIYANDYRHQAFAFGTGVPEPASWALMIVGFGAMGAMLRRRRMAAVPA